MPGNWKRRAAWSVALVLFGAGLAWFLWPKPIAADLADITRGPMGVTVDDEGKTRVRHVYTVSAPIAGKVLRISHPYGQHGISLHAADRAKLSRRALPRRAAGHADGRRRLGHIGGCGNPAHRGGIGVRAQ